MRFKIEANSECGKEYFTITLCEHIKPFPSLNIAWDNASSKASIAAMLESSINNLIIHAERNYRYD